MARLIVEAIVTNGFVRPGTTDPLPVTVSVTHADGSPDSSLVFGDFTIGATRGTASLVAQNFRGGVVQVAQGAVNAGGLYLFELTPIPGATWTPWTTYHVVIVVAHGNNHGQTIRELTFPHP
jgi:hypothetical protein